MWIALNLLWITITMQSLSANGGTGRNLLQEVYIPYPQWLNEIIGHTRMVAYNSEECIERVNKVLAEHGGCGEIVDDFIAAQNAPGLSVTSPICCREEEQIYIDYGGTNPEEFSEPQWRERELISICEYPLCDQGRWTLAEELLTTFCYIGACGDTQAFDHPLKPMVHDPPPQTPQTTSTSAVHDDNDDQCEQRLARALNDTHDLQARFLTLENDLRMREREITSLSQELHYCQHTPVPTPPPISPPVVTHPQQPHPHVCRPTSMEHCRSSICHTYQPICCNFGGHSYQYTSICAANLCDCRTRTEISQHCHPCHEQFHHQQLPHYSHVQAHQQPHYSQHHGGHH